MSTLAYTVSGSAVAADGRPLVGADILLTGTDGRRVARTRTDGLGNYELASFQRGPHLLVCSSTELDPHAAVVDLQSPQERHDVILAATGILVGVVCSGGQAVHGATVTVINDAAFALASMVTGPGGWYRFDDLLAGRYTVATHAPSGRPIASTVDVPAGGFADHDIDLPSAYELSGTVRDLDGRPVAGAEVTLVAASGAPVSICVADADGRYHFPELADNVYTLTATLRQEVHTQVRVPATNSVESVIGWLQIDPQPARVPRALTNGRGAHRRRRVLHPVVVLGAVAVTAGGVIAGVTQLGDGDGDSGSGSGSGSSSTSETVVVPAQQTASPEVNQAAESRIAPPPVAADPVPVAVEQAPPAAPAGPAGPARQQTALTRAFVTSTPSVPAQTTAPPPAPAPAPPPAPVPAQAAAAGEPAPQGALDPVLGSVLGGLL